MKPSRRFPARRRAAAGFTLLEVLIAITLLGVVMALLFTSLRIGIAGWDKGEKHSFEAGRMAIIQSFLREHLAGALPLMDDFSHEEPEFSFKGTEEALQFVSVMPAAGGRGGLRIFQVDLMKEQGGKSLRVTLRPFYPAFEEAEQTKEEVVILEKVERMEFAYYGPDTLGENKGWQTKWEEQKSLPELIRVDIQVEGEREWTPILVAPKLQKR